MTYRELYENALYDLEHDKITLGEFWKMTEPLEKRVNSSTIDDWIPCSEQEPDFRRMGKEYYDELDNVLNEMIPHTECVWEDDEILLNNKDDVGMTNLDWLRTMSDEELARWITNWTTKEQYRYTHSERALIDWLKLDKEGEEKW